jgi:hypothetical protein
MWCEVSLLICDGIDETKQKIEHFRIRPHQFSNGELSFKEDT